MSSAAQRLEERRRADKLAVYSFIALRGRAAFWEVRDSEWAGLERLGRGRARSLRISAILRNGEAGGELERTPYDGSAFPAYALTGAGRRMLEGA